jgi:enamine deaminase RidA (YjgF/YER057c/UK114 family)
LSSKKQGENKMATAEARLKDLKLTLPTPPKPIAKYKSAVQVGNILYVSGHGPAKIDANSPVQGKVGGDLTLEQGQESARLVGLNILATVRNTLGSLDKVKRLVKTLGMVNSTANFLQHPQVINGFSELMAQVFGDDAGVGSRSAVGMGSLPGNIPVEVECIFEVE